jgi:Ca-activated chloride channel family protein
MPDRSPHALSTGPAILVLLLLLLATGCQPSAGSLNQDGNEAFANGNYEEALADYEQAQVADPETAEPYYNAANTLYRQEAYNDAQTQLQQALQHAQGDLSQYGLYNLGNSHYNAAQLDAAIAAYKEALLLNPNDLDAKYNLELALQQQQQEQQQEQQDEQDQQEQDQQEPDQQNQEPQPEPQPDQGEQDQVQPTPQPGEPQPTPQPGEPPQDPQQAQNEPESAPNL